VRLRLFAAAREAAGSANFEVDAATVGQALKLACERFGPRFEDVLSYCTVVVGDEQFTIDAAAGLEAEEIALLPPVSGGARMADVSDKDETRREAVASCRLVASGNIRDRIMRGDLPKGEPLEAARIAGILAAKRVPELIPLCHPVRMSHIDVSFERDGEDSIAITATIRGIDRTGFEVEALTAASVAALTLYDMAKSEDARMTVTDLRLDSKSGGKSGEWHR
jgi:cyclic pyranopterin monophosphate synthase